MDAALNIDVNTLLARLSARLGQAAQTIEIQQLQIEKLQAVIAAHNAQSENNVPEKTAE
jgi:hypothetical protein